MTVTISPTDGVNAKLLKKCEADIKKGQELFLTTARAVLTIREKKLFAPHFKSASAYFFEKWDMSPTDVTRYTKAAEVLMLLEMRGCTKLPENEGQARALSEIAEDDKRVDVWLKAMHSGERITAKKLFQLANPIPSEMDKPSTTSPVQHSVCHWALQNQPLMGASKPAEV